MANKPKGPRYGRIDMRMWADKKFLALSPLKPSGQALWMYLLTGPLLKRMPGIILSSRYAATEKLCWSRRTTAHVFEELVNAGMVKYCEKPYVIWLVNAHKYEPPNNKDHFLSWQQAWREVPECPLKDEIRQVLMADLGTRFTVEAAAVLGATVPPTVPPTVGGGKPPHGDTPHIASNIYPIASTPPTPLAGGEGEGGKGTPANQPGSKASTEAAAAGLNMLTGPVRELVKLYKDRVNPSHGVGGGEQAITEAIAYHGLTTDALRRAVENFAAHVEREQVERSKRPGLKGFVRDGVWREYADAELAAPPTKPAAPAYSLKAEIAQADAEAKRRLADKSKEART